LEAAAMALESERTYSSVVVVLLAYAAAASAACATGCGKKDTTELAPAASALAASAPVAASWRYVIDPKSTTQVDMPGVKEHIKGGTTGATGSLDVVPKDLAQSRGLVRIDLSTFSTHTFGTDEDAAQTKHARTWLEVVSGEAGDKMNDDMRYADLAIRSIDTASASDLTTVAPTVEGGDDVRTVSMTVHGELLVHGHKVPKDATVDVAFHYPTGTPPASKPSRLEIKSKQPLRVVLKEHDVRPRDTAGAVLEWTSRLISKVAETADITVDIGATPSS
jgi:hypothetical protein